MTSLNHSFQFLDEPTYSIRLERAFARIASHVVAVLAASGTRVVLTTIGPVSAEHRDTRAAQRDFFRDKVGDLVSCKQVEIDSGLLRRFKIPIENTVSLGEDADWSGFELRFDTGIDDLLLFKLRSSTDRTALKGVVSTLWPILREDCIADLQAVKFDMCENALLWMIANRIDVAILVMNSRGQVLRSNAAASNLLTQEWVLRKTAHGIRCLEDRQTREFHDALTRCATSDPTGSDTVVFLTSASGQKIPLTMARYWHDNQPTELITVMMPSPPDSRRVEMLARAGGLTPAEAKVASLLQLGMSNKDAASISGLKEQSVSTYAKRALSKLNVNSRAEMAQMLTWQAAGGHV